MRIIALEFLQQIYDNLVLNVTVILSGLAGGTVALIRSARAHKKPIAMKSILGSLFIAAFTAWMVSLLLPDGVSQNTRTVLCGIAGMSGDKILSMVDIKMRKKLRNMLRKL